MTQSCLKSSSNDLKCGLRLKAETFGLVLKVVNHSNSVIYFLVPSVFLVLV